MSESNLKSIKITEQLEEITKIAASNLETKIRNPLSTIEDAQKIFDKYKNDTFYIYKVVYKINFYRDEILYESLINSWDNFKLNMDDKINYNLPKKTDL